MFTPHHLLSFAFAGSTKFQKIMNRVTKLPRIQPTTLKKAMTCFATLIFGEIPAGATTSNSSLQNTTWHINYLGCHD